MASLDDFDFVAVVHGWPHVSPFDCRFRQARQRIETSEGPRRCLNARSLGGDCATYCRKDFRLELKYPFFGTENFAFPFLEGRGSKSLGIRQRLPALVIVRHAGSIRLRYFYEVTEDIVVPNAQVSDATSSALLSFQRRNDLFRVTTDRSQLIKFGCIAIANHPTLN